MDVSVREVFTPPEVPLRTDLGLVLIDDASQRQTSAPIWEDGYSNFTLPHEPRDINRVTLHADYWHRYATYNATLLSGSNWVTVNSPYQGELRDLTMVVMDGATITHSINISRLYYNTDGLHAIELDSLWDEQSDIYEIHIIGKKGRVISPAPTPHGFQINWDDTLFTAEGLESVLSTSYVEYYTYINDAPTIRINVNNKVNISTPILDRLDTNDLLLINARANPNINDVLYYLSCYDYYFANAVKDDNLLNSLVKKLEFYMTFEPINADGFEFENVASFDGSFLNGEPQ